MEELKSTLQVLLMEVSNLSKNISYMENDEVLHDDFNYVSNKIDIVIEELIKINSLIR